jgi:hypothetical protein
LRETTSNTLALARRCRRIIIVNFAGTIAVDDLGIGLAAVGLLNPLLAAFIHVSSELAFILNPARLPRSLTFELRGSMVSGRHRIWIVHIAPSRACVVMMTAAPSPEIACSKPGTAPPVL